MDRLDWPSIIAGVIAGLILAVIGGVVHGTRRILTRWFAASAEQRAQEARKATDRHKALSDGLADLSGALTTYARLGEARGFDKSLIPSIGNAIAKLKFECPELTEHLDKISLAISSQASYFDVATAQTKLLNPVIAASQKCLKARSKS